MTAPSNANTSGLEVVAWRVKDFADDWILFHTEVWARREAEGAGNLVQALTPAELAEARIRSLEEERDSWRRVAEQCKSETTAAEAKLARAVEGLRQIVHWRVEMAGTPVDTEAANAWAITFDTAATEASQTLAALK